MNVFFPNSCIFLCRGKNCISVQCYSDPEFSKVDMGPWDKTRNITANMYLSFCYIMFLTFSLEDEHVSKIVIEGCWIRSIAFCSRSARFWDFHLKMNLFLGLALEDGGEATLQQGYHWIDQHVSEIVSGKCFWGCLCGIWTCFWGWDQLKMFLRFSLEDGELKDRSLRRRPSSEQIWIDECRLIPEELSYHHSKN